MGFHYDVVYLKGVNQENEDAYVAMEETGVFSVIDGATGLGSLSGKMAAEIIKETLEQEAEHQSLMNSIDIGNGRIRKKVCEKMNTDDFDSIPKENRSTCGLATIRIKENKVEYVHGGDCMIFVQYGNKEIRQITYDHLSKLDGVSIELHKHSIDSRLGDGVDVDPNTWSETEITNLLKDTRQEILPKIIENRRKLNTKGGYGVLDGSSEAISYLDYGMFPLYDAKRILLLSDGLQLPFHKATGQDAWVKTASYAFDNGLEALKNEVLNLESTDKACYTYPRLKFADDKTGILIEFE
ncbi:protein phosphatase 2C domain-containing protein [Peribacillus sp. NPDC097198]|uniref:protein phosphatase 2C domain-containing protein n=1 Tax=Peribacillus sp. NPDC097198 TaxID=3364397 RepID=UPI0037F67241